MDVKKDLLNVFGSEVQEVLLRLKKTDANDEDAEDLSEGSEEEDFESIPWLLEICLSLYSAPVLEWLSQMDSFGQATRFTMTQWAGHWCEQGWQVTVGFSVRMTTQQMQLRAGYWLIVPLASIHLTFAALALVYTTSEWAVFGEIVVAMGIDSSCAIEGIAFDSFGASEGQARQATSTVLSVFTIAIALSCTVGGAIYDLWGWTGVAGYHTLFQSLLLLMLITQPAIGDRSGRPFSQLRLPRKKTRQPKNPMLRRSSTRWCLQGLQMQLWPCQVW